MNNISACDKFKPTILEGQLCYSLDIAELKEYPTKSGKSNGLLLLLDPKPYEMIEKDGISRGSEIGGQNFKVFVNTLAQYTSFGPGSYAMNSLKKMTGTKSFQKLPESQKKCRVHDREVCQTKNYLEQVQEECKCLPWSLQTDQVKISQKSISMCFLQEIPNCGQGKEECIANATLKNKDCLIPCDGLYADIENFDLRQITIAGCGINMYCILHI